VSHKLTKKVAHYILLYIYILSYYLYARDNQLWCCGEAGISWGGVGIIDFWRIPNRAMFFGVVE
jgi:hypothetical protein